VRVKLIKNTHKTALEALDGEVENAILKRSAAAIMLPATKRKPPTDGENVSCFTSLPYHKN
jgi:hypothetical protein